MAVRVTVTRQLLRRGTPHREKHPDHGGQLSHGGDIRLDLIPQARVLHLDGTDLVQQAQGLEVGLQAYGPSRGSRVEKWPSARRQPGLCLVLPISHLAIA